MKRAVTILVAMIALVAVAGSAAAAALRSPQVVFSSGSLQGYLNSQGETINVLTDQLAAQRWQSTVSNNSTFTIQAELAGNAGSNTYGLYNASGPPAPPLYQLFPGAATTGWFAVASFRSLPTRVIVNLFDNNAALVGTNTYLGADKTDFGFYLSGPGGLFYTQDSRNAGNPQMLAFAGNGINAGSFWLACEDLPFGNGPLTDFDDAILFCESIVPTPVNKTTWGSLKARFH